MFGVPSEVKDALKEYVVKLQFTKIELPGSVESAITLNSERLSNIEHVLEVLAKHL